MQSSCELVAQSCPTPWTAAHQAPLSRGFSRQEYWGGLPFPSWGDFPNPGIELGFPALQGVSLLSEPLGKAIIHHISSQIRKKKLMQKRHLKISIHEKKLSAYQKWNGLYKKSSYCHAYQWKTKYLPHKIRNRVRTFTLTTPVWHHMGNPNQGNKARKRNEGYRLEKKN